MDFTFYLAGINILLNGGMLIYIVKIETRFTRLETQMTFLLKNGTVKA